MADRLFIYTSLLVSLAPFRIPICARVKHITIPLDRKTTLTADEYIFKKLTARKKALANEVKSREPWCPPLGQE